MSIATIELNGTNLIVQPQGAYRYLSLRREIEIARSQVVSVAPLGSEPAFTDRGMRIPGTDIPRGFKAGTFWKFWGGNQNRSFPLFKNPASSIRIDLRDHVYTYVVVEVDHPAAEVARIETWLCTAGTPAS